VAHSILEASGNAHRPIDRPIDGMVREGRTEVSKPRLAV
jgi:hypothetical protein